MSPLQKRYHVVLEKVVHHAAFCGRDSSVLTVIAVSKNHFAEDVEEVVKAGGEHFGENRVQEALGKMEALPSNLKWHFIGTLQKNKVRKVVEQFTLIHSVDSLELVKKISEVSQERGSVTELLLQVNTSGELSKHGFTPKELRECFEEIIALPFICVSGLMTMAPYTKDLDVVRHCFRTLRILKDSLQQQYEGKVMLKHLSMGMSNDYVIAIEEGATLLRIGSQIFSDPE